MKREEHWQKALQEQRIPHQVRLQSEQIDRVMARHRVPAQVAGGEVRTHEVQFDLHASLESGLDLLRGLKQELLSVLGVTDVSLQREGGSWRLRVDRPEDPPVALLDLLPLLPPLEPGTVTLGLGENGRPILLELADEDVAHMLIFGDSGAGKTSLLRTVAVSLALTNRQSQLQLVVINGAGADGVPGYADLEPLTYLPHLLEPVVTNPVDAVSILQFLVDEVRYRNEQAVDRPTIVVLIDRLVALLAAAGDGAADAILFLLQKGAAAGVHLVMATDEPASEQLNDYMHASVPVRVVGQVMSPEAGVAATGLPDAHPDYLMGQGDFLAVVGDEVTHFQAAYVGDYDLHLILDTLHRNRPQPLLAHPLDVRPRVDKEVKEPELVYRFEATVAETENEAAPVSGDDDEAEEDVVSEPPVPPPHVNRKRPFSAAAEPVIDPVIPEDDDGEDDAVAHPPRRTPPPARFMRSSEPRPAPKPVAKTPPPDDDEDDIPFEAGNTTYDIDDDNELEYEEVWE